LGHYAEAGATRNEVRKPHSNSSCRYAMARIRVTG